MSNSSVSRERTTADDRPRPPLVTGGDVEYLAALGVAAALGLLPASLRAAVINWLSVTLGQVWHRLNRGSVRRVRRHAQRLFGYALDDPALEVLVRRQLTLASWNAILINLLPSLRDEHLSHLLPVEGLHYLDEARGRDQPVVLLSAHYGAYGYAVAAALSAHGYPVWLVGYGDSQSPRPGASRLYRRLYWPRVQRLAERIQLITIDRGLAWQPQLRHILEQKREVVYFLPDQYFVVPPDQSPPPNLAPFCFLSHTAHLDLTGIGLVREMDAQLLTAIPVQDGRRQRIVIEPAPWADGGSIPTDPPDVLQAYLRWLEQYVLKDPALWRDLRRADLLQRMGLFERHEQRDE